MTRERQVQSLTYHLMRGHLSRRDFITRAAALGLSATAIGSLLAACGETDDDEIAEATDDDPDETDDEPVETDDTVDDEEPSEPTDDETDDPDEVDADEPVSGGTFTYGSQPPPINVINPLLSTSTNQNVMIEPIFMRLVYGREWGDDMNPQEDGDIDLGICESMTELEENQAWEFELRQDVYWHDGEQVTADDVIFGAWMLLHPDSEATNETPMTGLKGAEAVRENPGDEPEIDGITKIDDFTIRIELEAPIPNYWVNWSVGYWPMPAHIYSEIPPDEWFEGELATMPVGNGPFKAVEFVDGQYFEMEANEDFFLGRPLLDRLIIRFGDPDTLTAALEAGEIDGVGQSVGTVYDRLEGLDHIVGTAVPRDHPDGFALNVERVDDAPEVLKAIQHAIDVETISERLYSDTLEPSNNLFEHVVGLEDPPEGFEERTYDPDRAREILDEIGWDSNQELEWMMWSPPQAQQDALQAMLADVGINTTYRVIDAATVIDDLYLENNFDIVFGNFGADQSMEFNWRYFRCDWTYDEGGFNYSNYCNDEVDDLFEQALAEHDVDTQRELFQEALLILNEQPPQATIWRTSIGYLWNTRVQGVYPYQYRLPIRAPFERLAVQPD